MDQWWLTVCGFHWIWRIQKKKGKESILKRYVYTTVLHIVLDLFGKESKENVYGNDMFIQLFYTLYLIYMEKKVKQMFMERICLYNCFIRCV